MLVKLNKRLGNYSKFALQFISNSKIFIPASIAAFSLAQDKNLISQTKNLIINQTRLKETSQESINKGIEQIYTNLLQNDLNTQQVSKSLHELSEQFNHVRQSTSSIYDTNEHLKFILEKAIYALKENYSHEDFVELLRFCNLAGITDTNLYDRLARIGQKNIPSLEEKLQIMCEFNEISFVQFEDLPSCDSLKMNECIYILYLSKVLNYFDSSNEEFSALQSQILDKILAKRENLNVKPDQLQLLFSVFIQIQREDNNKQLVNVSKENAEMLDAVEKNIKKFPNKQLIQMYVAVRDFDLNLNKSKKMISKIAKLLDERIPQMNPQEISSLIFAIHNMDPKLNTQSFLYEADKTVINSITMNVLSEKDKVLDINFQTLSNMLEIHSKWQLWNDSINEIFVNISIALFEVRRIRAHNFINVVIKLSEVNNGKVPSACLSLLRVRAKDFINEAKTENLLDLYQAINSYGETARTFKVCLIDKISTILKDGEFPAKHKLFQKRFFHFFFQNLESFDIKLIQLYISKLEGFFQDANAYQIFAFYSVLLKVTNFHFLLEEKGKCFLYVLEKHMNVFFEKLPLDQKSLYLKLLSQIMLKLEKLKEKRSDLQFCEPQDYNSLKDQQNLVLPVNISILRNQTEVSDVFESSNKELTHNERFLFIQKSILTGNEEAMNKLLTNMNQNLLEDNINIHSLVHILRSHSTLRLKFKKNFIEKDPKVGKSLLKILNEELDKDEAELNKNFSPDSGKSVSFNLFVMTNFLLEWKAIDDQLRLKLRVYIEKNIDKFDLDEILQVISFGNSVFQADIRTLFNKIIERLGIVMFQQNINFNQAYNLLMGLNFTLLDDKTFFELEKIIAENFLNYRIQEITKLVEKFEKNNKRSTKILWKVINIYFQPSYILNLRPNQIRTLIQVLIKENYGMIFDSILYYLLNNKNQILTESNLTRVLFYYIQHVQTNNSEELANICKQSIESLFSVSKSDIFIYLLAISNHINSNSQFSQEQLEKRWKELIENTNIKDIPFLSIDLANLRDTSNLLQTYPWITNSIFEYISKNKEKLDSDYDIVLVYSHLNFESSALKNNKEIISQLIPVFLNLKITAETISKFTLAWARSLETAPEEEMITQIRQKILKINSLIYQPSYLIFNLLNVILEMEKFQRKNYFFTRNDYKFLNRLENLVFANAGVYRREELVNLYQFYVDNNLGSNRLLEFLEKKLV